MKSDIYLKDWIKVEESVSGVLGMFFSWGISYAKSILSALQITTKLCEAEFVRKAKAVDFFSRTWEAFLDAGAGKGEDVVRFSFLFCHSLANVLDKIMDIILVFFAALLARDPSILSDLAQRPPTSSLKEDDDRDGHGSFVDCLFQLLGIVISKKDPLLLVSSKNHIDSDLIKKAGINKRDFGIVCSCPQIFISLLTWGKKYRLRQSIKPYSRNPIYFPQISR
jgi:hypothetical protein